MSELKTMIENTKYAVEHDTRYKKFTILETPTMFKELFKDKDIEIVQVHTVERINDTNDIVGFCGVFQWKDNEITPLDHDMYNAKTIVYAYSWFSTKRDESLNALDIIVGNDW